MERRRILIAGASGVVGQAAVRHFAAQPGWEVAAVSRRPPRGAGLGIRHVPLDLTDAEACRRTVRSELRGITHLVFAALYEKPDIVAGWRDGEQMATNLAMLQNLVDPLTQTSTLRHVTLLQGTKAYGVHIRPFAAPAKESWPRHDHLNFYWLQEDWLKRKAASEGFATTIFRPQVIFGDSIGVAMNIIPVLGVLAAIRRQEGRAFSYPGGPSYLLEAVDAGLLARALAWAATAPQAAGETFNITNGDVFAWPNIWPTIADALDMELGPDEPARLAAELPAKTALWDAAVQRHGLRRNNLAELVGHSHHYADFCLASGAERSPAPVLVSTIKLRQAGFADCVDTETMFREQIGALRRARIIP